MNDDELNAWHRAEADRRHNDAMRQRNEANDRARADSLRDQQHRENIQRAQQASWDHEARIKAQYTNVARAHSQYQQRPNDRNFDRLEHAHRDYRNTVYGSKSHEPIDPGRFPQAPTHHWWQVWKRK
jgi:hypothetical protein